MAMSFDLPNDNFILDTNYSYSPYRPRAFPDPAFSPESLAQHPRRGRSEAERDSGGPPLEDSSSRLIVHPPSGLQDNELDWTGSRVPFCVPSAAFPKGAERSGVGWWGSELLGSRENELKVPADF